MFLYFKISCKEKKTLKKFTHFFQRLNFLPVSLKLFSKQKKQKFVTVLKSPHVNKTAQEQFEYRFYSKDFLVRSFKPLTFFLLLKKLKNQSFPGINLKVEGLFEKNSFYKYTLRIVTPDNLCLGNNKMSGRSLKTISMVPRPNYRFMKRYVQLFDLHGEICFKNFFCS
nr:ribosomal protein S10 [Nitzschia ovalis]